MLLLQTENNNLQKLYQSIKRSGRELKDITFRDLTLCIYIGYIQLESKTKYKSINGQRVSPENDEVIAMHFVVNYLFNNSTFVFNFFFSFFLGKKDDVEPEPCKQGIFHQQ